MLLKSVEVPWLACHTPEPIGDGGVAHGQQASDGLDDIPGVEDVGSTLHE